MKRARSEWENGAFFPLSLLACSCLFTATFSTEAGDETVAKGKDSKAVVEQKPEPRFKIYGWVESGITVNPDAPRDNQNFGRLFDDRSNEPMLNQFVITLERALAPEPGKFDWGFKFQFMEGSDARFTHSLGLFSGSAPTSVVQPDIVEAYLNLHFPVITAAGLDLKLGKFVTLEGAETIDPRTNFFYSHSYIFNFAIPFNDTGAMAVLHANKWLAIDAGITRGVNTSIDDNNDSVAFEGGVGLTFFEGKLVISAATHIGPETPNDNHDKRFLNCITTTWKVTDKLNAITDLNYTHDEVSGADTYGAAQYFTCTINSWLTAGLRGEIFSDQQNFYVTSFANYHDPMRGLEGQSVIDPRTIGGGAAGHSTTYGAITAGVNIKPSVPRPLASLTIRPEVRYDHTLNDVHAFNDSSDRGMLTFGIDAVLTF